MGIAATKGFSAYLSFEATSGLLRSQSLSRALPRPSCQWKQVRVASSAWRWCHSRRWRFCFFCRLLLASLLLLFCGGGEEEVGVLFDCWWLLSILNKIMSSIENNDVITIMSSTQPCHSVGGSTHKCQVKGLRLGRKDNHKITLVTQKRDHEKSLEFLRKTISTAEHCSNHQQLCTTKWGESPSSISYLLKYQDLLRLCLWSRHLQKGFAESTVGYLVNQF